MMDADDLEKSFANRQTMIRPSAVLPAERLEQLQFANLLLCRLGTTPVTPCLLVNQPTQAVRQVPLRDGLSLGRGKTAGLQFDLAELSKQHLAFHECGPDDWEVEDLSSSNGTFLNRERVEGRQPLNSGDIIEAGGQLFLFLT